MTRTLMLAVVGVLFAVSPCVAQAVPAARRDSALQLRHSFAATATRATMGSLLGVAAGGLALGPIFPGAACPLGDRDQDRIVCGASLAGGTLAAALAFEPERNSLPGAMLGAAVGTGVALLLTPRLAPNGGVRALVVFPVTQGVFAALGSRVRFPGGRR